MNVQPTSTPLHTGTLRKSRRWRRAWWLLFALGVLALWSAFTLLDSVNPAPVHVSVNGTPLLADLDLAAMEPIHKLVLALGIAIVLLVALFVAVGTVVVALVAVVPIVVFALLVPLLVGAVLLAPLVLLGWLLWRAVRPAPRSTTMAA
jgi:hypothetical protein